MSWTSAPAQKTDPVPVSTTARTESVSPSSRTASPMAVTTSGVTELPRRGRFNRTMPIGSCASMTISLTSPSIPALVCALMSLHHLRHMVGSVCRRHPLGELALDLPTSDLRLRGEPRNRLRRDVDVARPLEPSQAAVEPGHQLGRLVSGEFGRVDERGGSLTPLGIRNTDHDRLPDGRVLFQGAFELNGLDVRTTRDDRFTSPSDDPNPAFLIEATYIRGPPPSVVEQPFLVLRGRAEQLRCEARRADDELTVDPRTQVVGDLAVHEHRELDTGHRPTDRRPQRRRLHFLPAEERRGRGRLRLAPTLHERIGVLADDLERRQGGRLSGQHHAAQLRPPEQRELVRGTHSTEHRGNREHPINRGGCDGFERLIRVEPRDDDVGATPEESREDAPATCIHQRGDLEGPRGGDRCAGAHHPG